MENYFSLLSENNLKRKEQNDARFAEYQQNLKAQQAQKDEANNILFSMASGKGSQEPFTLKSMSGVAPQTQASTKQAQIAPESPSFNTPQPQMQTPDPVAIAPQAAMSIPEVAAGVGAVATGIESLRGVGNVAKGNDLTFTQQAALALPTFGGSFIYNPVSKIWGGHKDKDQKQRDSVRSNLKEGGLIDDAYNLTLADGTKFDIGKDGSEKLYNIDPEGTPYTHDVIDWTNPIGLILGNGNSKIQSDFTGYFSNAAISNATDAATAKANVQAFYDKMGWTKDQWYSAIDQLQSAGKVTEQDAAIYKSKLDQFKFAQGDKAQAASMPSFGGFSITMPKQPKPLPPAPPTTDMDFSLLNMVQNSGGGNKQSGEVLFNDALKGILGSQK